MRSSQNIKYLNLKMHQFKTLNNMKEKFYVKRNRFKNFKGFTFEDKNISSPYHN